MATQPTIDQLMPQDILVPQLGIPVTVKLRNARTEQRVITSSDDGQKKTVPALLFDVVEKDGKPASSLYSVVSKKHAAAFRPYLDDGSYVSKTFRITKKGTGFNTEYQLQVL